MSLIRTNIRLSPEIAIKVTRMAKVTGMPMSLILRKAVKNGMEAVRNQEPEPKPVQSVKMIALASDEMSAVRQVAKDNKESLTRTFQRMIAQGLPALREDILNGEPLELGPHSRGPKKTT